VDQVSLHERPHAETCPFCHDAIRGGQEVWPCEKCGTRLHGACFRENRLRCTVLGCGGQAVVPEGATREGEVEPVAPSAPASTLPVPWPNWLQIVVGTAVLFGPSIAGMVLSVDLELSDRAEVLVSFAALMFTTVVFLGLALRNKFG
jgi:hypothetical protein